MTTTSTTTAAEEQQQQQQQEDHNDNQQQESNNSDKTESTKENEETMLAYAIPKAGDTHGEVMRIPKPKPDGPGFALIRVLRAGVCNTDLEILKGYMGFHGVLGHEFVGIVEDVNADAAIKEQWIGKRVCGDINVGCAACSVCFGCLDKRCSKMGRNHCPHRTVLGILNRNGTMAEYLTLPVSNLHVVPDSIPDDEAVFAEPLAAACRIPEQGLVRYDGTDPERVAILGDGKLGLMIAEVLGREHMAHYPNTKDSDKPVLFGKHDHKLALVKGSGVNTMHVSACQDASAFNGVAADHSARYDVVVEATGSPAGLNLAAGLCRPMGTLVSVCGGSGCRYAFDSATCCSVSSNKSELHPRNKICSGVHCGLGLVPHGSVRGVSLPIRMLPCGGAPEPFFPAFVASC